MTPAARFAEQWDASIAWIRKILTTGRLVAMAGYYGTSNSVFAVFFAPHVWRRHHNDNHREKRE